MSGRTYHVAAWALIVTLVLCTCAGFVAGLAWGLALAAM